MTAKLPLFKPQPRPTSLPKAMQRWCADPACGGPFRANWRSETQSDSNAVVTHPPDLTCPTCGGPSAEEPPAKLPARTYVPASIADDPLLRKLLEREKALPLEIRTLEARLQELKANRKQATEAIGTVKVRVSVGVAKQAELDRATDSLDEIEADIRRAEDAMDVAVASQRAVVEELEARSAVLREERKKPLVEAARKYRDDINKHFDAIERLIGEADAIGADHEQIYHAGWLINGTARTHDLEATTAIGVLRHLATGRRGSKRLLDLVARFREHASRL